MESKTEAEKKALVVYYSRTGTTKKVAEAIAGKLGADLEEIVDRKRRAGLVGFLVAGKDAKFKKLTQIEEPRLDPAAYELVVVGTPVWAGTMSCAVRSYLARFKDRLPRLAFFLTTGGMGVKSTFRAMAKLAGRQPAARLGLKQKEVRKGDWQEELDRFVAELGNAAGEEPRGREQPG